MQKQEQQSFDSYDKHSRLYGPGPVCRGTAEKNNDLASFVVAEIAFFRCTLDARQKNKYNWSHTTRINQQTDGQ